MSKPKECLCGKQFDSAEGLRGHLDRERLLGKHGERRRP